jgi:hypothetical protein
MASGCSGFRGGAGLGVRLVNVTIGPAFLGFSNNYQPAAFSPSHPKQAGEPEGQS